MNIYLFFRRYRYVAYQQFVRWTYSVLGKNIRVPLPTCVVGCVRRQFPLKKNNEGFEGFCWAYEDIVI